MWSSIKGADHFVCDDCGQIMWSVSWRFYMPGGCIVTLVQPFVKGFSIKICTAIDKEKAGSNYIQHVCADALVHTWWRWCNYTKVTFPMLSKANIWYAVSKEKRMFGMIISIGTDNLVPISVPTDLSITLLKKLQDHWTFSKILLRFVKKWV